MVLWEQYLFTTPATDILVGGTLQQNRAAEISSVEFEPVVLGLSAKASVNSLIAWSSSRFRRMYIAQPAWELPQTFYNLNGV